MIAPRTSFCLGALLVLLTLQAIAQPKPLATAQAIEIAAGKRIFHAQCAWCHGTEGTGGAGPSLQRSALRHAKDDTDLVTIVRNGIAGTEMPGLQWSLTDTMAWQTAAYVRSLGRIAPEPARGSAERGAAIYAARGCDACHILGGRGKAVGPELTSVGALRGVAYLRQAIVKPEAEHPPGFLVVNAAGAAAARFVAFASTKTRSGSIFVTQMERCTISRRRTCCGSNVISTARSCLHTRPHFPRSELDDLVAYLASRRGER